MVVFCCWCTLLLDFTMVWFSSVWNTRRITHESLKTYFQWGSSGGELDSTPGDNPLLFSEECTAFLTFTWAIAHGTDSLTSPQKDGALYHTCISARQPKNTRRVAMGIEPGTKVIMLRSPRFSAHTVVTTSLADWAKCHSQEN